MYSFTQPKLVCFEPSVFYSMQSLFIIVLREIKADGRKMHSIILSYFTTKQILFFYCECTQIKADLLQSDYLHDQEELLPLLEGE